MPSASDRGSQPFQWLVRVWPPWRACLWVRDLGAVWVAYLRHAPPIFRRFPAVETAGYRCQAPTGHWLRVVFLASFSLIAVNNSGQRICEISGTYLQPRVEDWSSLVGACRCFLSPNTLSHSRWHSPTEFPLNGLYLWGQLHLSAQNASVCQHYFVILHH